MKWFWLSVAFSLGATCEYFIKPQHVTIVRVDPINELICPLTHKRHRFEDWTGEYFHKGWKKQCKDCLYIHSVPNQ